MWPTAAAFDMQSNEAEAGRHRRLISQILVAGLIAVAYSEPVGPVTEAFDGRGVGLGTLTWIAIYGATVLRFFIGNIVHLENPDLAGPDAIFRWFWDLSFIIAESVILIFAGAVATLDSSATAEVSFTDYLVILYGLDLVWLGSMQLMSKLGERSGSAFRSMVRRQDMAPFEWAVVNVILGLLMWGLDLIGRHPVDVPDWKLWLLLGANVAVFFWDLIKIAYGIREDNADLPTPQIIHSTVRMRLTALVHRTRNRLGWKISGGGGMNCALAEARRSFNEGGIPIGACLVDGESNVIGTGRNRRIQRNNPMLHAEIDCLGDAERRHDYSDTTLYSTLMPCYMCAGAIIQFGIPRLVVGESRNFSGARALLKKGGVELVDLDDPECRSLLKTFISRRPEVWHEDIGEMR